MYKEDLALNNLQGLICHKTQPTQNNFTLHLFLCIENQREGRNCLWSGIMQDLLIA